MPRRWKQKKKRYSVPRAPVLYIEEILRWADAWKARTGFWPKRTSGRIPETARDKWNNIDNALHKGLRGLPLGFTLAQLLAERRGVRNPMRLPPFEVSEILVWADAYKRRTGDWPRGKTPGPIADAPGETWMAVDVA